MIHYTLKCDQGHRFDSWFQSAAAFDKLRGAAMVACSVCGSTTVEKSLMAPSVRPARNAPAGDTAEKTGADTPPAPGAGALSNPRTDLEKAVAALKAQVEKNSENVGLRFAQEARAIHDGAAPKRAIHGEAKPEDARALIEDGVPVAPLPFRPGRKSN